MSLYQMIRCALSPGMSVDTSQGSLATPPLTASAAETPSETKQRLWLATFNFYPRTRVKLHGYIFSFTRTLPFIMSFNINLGAA